MQYGLKTIKINMKKYTTKDKIFKHTVLKIIKCEINI